MNFKLSEKTIKILIFIFFATAPLFILVNLGSFDYYSAFDELKRATGIARKDLEIMNYWHRGADYVVKVRIYKQTEFKVKFIKQEDGYSAEQAMFYDEGWKPLSDFLKLNNLVRKDEQHNFRKKTD